VLREIEEEFLVSFQHTFNLSWGRESLIQLLNKLFIIVVKFFAT
jgi:hypothetical protein